MQVYNFDPDARTHRPSGTIEYEIDEAGTNEKVAEFSEEVTSIPNASASQVVIQKLVSLNSLQPGNYVIRIRATDKNRNQNIVQQAIFTVSKS